MSIQPQRPGLTTLAAVAFGAVVAAVAFLLSDNIHSLSESVAFDRLMLGLRFWEPAQSRWDTNFPLGTHVVMAVPHALGLDPVLWGRAVSLLGATASSVLAWLLVRRLAGAHAAAAAVAALWCIPAFVRGAVVVGEESIYTACVLAALLGLQQSAARRRLGLPLAILAANAAVLFRLDAISVLPGLVVAAGLLLGLRRAALFGIGACGTTLLHLLVGWSGGGQWNGDPLGFARVARATTQANSSGFAGLGEGSLLDGLASELGALPALHGGLFLVAAVIGAGLLVRRTEPPARALGAVTLWLFAVDLVLTVLGVLEPRTDRYFVPLTVLLTVSGVAAMWGTWGHRAALRALIALCALGAVLNLGSIVEQARNERLPDGLDAIAIATAQHVQPGDRVLVGEEHPTLVILAGLPWQETDVMPAGSPSDSTAERVRAALTPSTRWLVQVSQNPPTSSLDELSGTGVGLTRVEQTACCALWRVER